MARAYERDLELEALNAGEPPEEFHTCEECGGEGSTEKWESVSKWSIDPPSAIAIPCITCGGAGGFFCEAESDR